MNNIDVKVALVNRFVVKSKRQRLVQFASSPKRHDDWIEAFSGPGIFEARCLKEVAGDFRAPYRILSTLMEMGCRNTVFAVSTDCELDDKWVNLTSVIGNVVGCGEDVVLFCPESSTALYEWHHSGRSYLLSSVPP